MIPSLFEFISWNATEIATRSLINCHTLGVDSIQIYPGNGYRVRMFIAHAGRHNLYRNFPEHVIPGEDMSIAFHPHHCDIEIIVISGAITNWIVSETADPARGRRFTRWMYQSPITGSKGESMFVMDGDSLIDTMGGCQVLRQGDKAYMNAREIHTVAVERDVTAAWVIIEGAEDKEYKPLCYSNTDLTRIDSRDLYKPMTLGYLRNLLTGLSLNGRCKS